MTQPPEAEKREEKKKQEKRRHSSDIERRSVYLVDALGEDHAAENVLEIGDGVGLDGEAEILELAAAALVLLVEHLAVLAVAGVPRRPLHPPLEWAPRDLEDLRSLLSDPRFHSALYRLHWRRKSIPPRSPTQHSLLRDSFLFFFEIIVCLFIYNT